MVYNSYYLIGQPISKLQINDIKYLIILTILGFYVQMYMINYPSSAVYGENYMGKYLSKYIKRKFYIDKYPPFSTMLYTLILWILNYNQEFNLKDIKITYSGSNIPFVYMRIFSVIFGVSLIPITYLILRIMKFTKNTAVFGSMLIIFESSIVIQSRFLFVDSLALFFTALVNLFWRLFENHQQDSFKRSWWICLAATGIVLGALISTNWLGIFTLLWVSILACLQLWHFIEDLTIGFITWIKHFFSRVLCLIIIPILFYITIFYFHINYLKNADNNLFLSPEFLATFSNRNPKIVPAEVRYGSKITIRHFSSLGGYLHSHPHSYPSGSKQQQVTLYLYEDNNNNWLITDSVDESQETQSLSILDGSIIRLYHLETDKRLHSHDIRPSLSDTEWQNEVSGYGHKGFSGDNNDLFRIEIDKSRSYTEKSKINVRAIETKFRLIHVPTGCALFSNHINLPDWGYNQIEVTCAKSGIIENSLWYIESNISNDIEMVTYRKIGFFKKFWELQKSMWEKKFNSATPYNPSNHPSSWPLLKYGMRFWTTKDRQIYFLGNPLIWWSAIFFIGIYCSLKIFCILRQKKGYSKCNDRNCLRYDYIVGTSLIGWALHYLPFYFMKKQFFLYQYIPALYFSIISLCSFWDFISTRLLRKIQCRLLTLFFFKIIISVYFILAPLVYGFTIRKEHCSFIKFLKTWDLDC
ncbi:hypothetical protein PCK1_002364 [Pneumocystis canis]|nr:hypothetical protein PCK1_002364 [Pneumocystis canis]